MTPEERRSKEEHASMMISRMNPEDRLDMLRRAGLPIEGVIITDNVTITKGDDMAGKEKLDEQVKATLTASQKEAFLTALQSSEFSEQAGAIRHALMLFCEEHGVEFPPDPDEKRGGARGNPNSLKALKRINENRKKDV